MQDVTSPNQEVKAEADATPVPKYQRPLPRRLRRKLARMQAKSKARLAAKMRSALEADIIRELKEREEAEAIVKDYQELVEVRSKNENE